jgi:hypothetical protein
MISVGVAANRLNRPFRMAGAQSMREQRRRAADPATPNIGGSGLSRRRWLSRIALAFSGLARTAWGQPPSKSKASASELEIVAQVQAKARKAGLPALTLKRTEHFLGLGDAPVRFLDQRLDVCESMAKTFPAYFAQHGFQISIPDRRMTVIALKDDASYRAYIGADSPESVGGHYDVENDQLVVFDFGSLQRELAAEAKRVNTFTLVHETAHLLSFDTGLLSRRADVPACISEGLATYVELWRPGDRRAFGATNRARLKGLKDAASAGVSWISMSDLVADDAAFDNPKTVQLAYAESWLLVHFLMKSPGWLPKFQAYLIGIPKDRGAKKRLEYAESRLGSLRTLDKAVRRHRDQELER